MSVFPDCQGKKLIEKPPRVFANFGRLAVHDHAQGFLNKLKQKNTPSNQPQEICNLPTIFRSALVFVNCLFSSGPYSRYTTLTFDGFGILSATSSLSIRFFRCNSHRHQLAPWLFGLLSFRSSSFLTIFRRTFKERLIDVCILARG